MEEMRQRLRQYAKILPPLTSEMQDHMVKLEVICSNPVVESAYNKAVAHVYPVIETKEENLWLYTNIQDFIEYFRTWFTDLPKPQGGLVAIFSFPCFYMYNPSPCYFLNKLKSRSGDTNEFTKEIFSWTVDFIKIRGNFMDSPESTKHIPDWVSDPSMHMEDFIIPKGGFKSFNEFFTRELDLSKKPRPISGIADGSVVVAPADIIVNNILSNVLLTTKMDVKGRNISMQTLLDDSEHAKAFEGGTAISGVLMPTDYHHYHSPVAGEIVESKEVHGLYYGESWFDDFSNPGQGDTDFSIFEDFHRAYYIIKTPKYGYVAMIAVGLMTVSRIMPSLVGDVSTYVAPGDKPVAVEKGMRLRNFAYGGSLNILIFEKGVMPCVSMLMGNRIGKMQPKT